MSNPVKYTDPSGHCPVHDDECWELQQQTQDFYKITLSGDWTKDRISTLQDSLGLIADHIGGMDIFRSIWQGTEFVKLSKGQSIDDACKGPAGACSSGRGTRIYLPDVLFGFSTLDRLSTIAHELGHIWDERTEFSSFGMQQRLGGGLWQLMAARTYSHWVNCGENLSCVGVPAWSVGPYDPQIEGSYARQSAFEDWARTFELWMVPRAELLRQTYTSTQWSVRLQFVDDMVFRWKQGVR